MTREIVPLTSTGYLLHKATLPRLRDIADLTRNKHIDRNIHRELVQNEETKKRF